MHCQPTSLRQRKMEQLEGAVFAAGPKKEHAIFGEDAVRTIIFSLFDLDADFMALNLNS